MLINTFGVVVGTAACNAHCPYCVSRQTGPVRSPGKQVLTRHRNWQAALKLAATAGTTTLLITGKGEPTLYPDDITHFLKAAESSSLAIKELQTNGLAIGDAIHAEQKPPPRMLEFLPTWVRNHGLNTVAISVVGVHDGQNARIFRRDYPPLADTVRYLRQLQLTVRLSVSLLKGYVDSPDKLDEVIEWAREHDVLQVTARAIRSAWSSNDDKASLFVRDHALTKAQERRITEHVDSPYKLRFSHGATLYSHRGRNICLTDCLTTPTEPDHIRTLIYHATNGQLDYDWYEGATLLSGVPIS